MAFESSFTKEKKPDQAVNENLTANAKRRLFHIVDDCFDFRMANGAYKQAQQNELFEEFQKQNFSISGNSSFKFFEKSSTKAIFAYLENLLHFSRNKAAQSSRNYSAGVERIKNVLESEGILWELEKDGSSNYRFRTVASEQMKETVDNVQELALNSRWKDSLEPYQKAVSMYSDGEFSYRIAEKLNLGIENVLKKICVDELELTDDRDSSSGRYIALLKEEDFFEKNNIMEEELNHIISATDMLRKKVEGDRKRHSDIGRTYSTLLVHQVSAFIYFLVKTYEQEHS